MTSSKRHRFRDAHNPEIFELLGEVFELEVPERANLKEKQSGRGFEDILLELNLRGSKFARTEDGARLVSRYEHPGLNNAKLNAVIRRPKHQKIVKLWLAELGHDVKAELEEIQAAIGEESDESEDSDESDTLTTTELEEQIKGFLDPEKSLQIEPEKVSPATSVPAHGTRDATKPIPTERQEPDLVHQDFVPHLYYAEHFLAPKNFLDVEAKAALLALIDLLEKGFKNFKNLAHVLEANTGEGGERALRNFKILMSRVGERTDKEEQALVVCLLQVSSYAGPDLRQELVDLQEMLKMAVIPTELPKAWTLYSPAAHELLEKENLLNLSWRMHSWLLILDEFEGLSLEWLDLLQHSEPEDPLKEKAAALELLRRIKTLPMEQRGAVIRTFRSAKRQPVGDSKELRMQEQLIPEDFKMTSEMWKGLLSLAQEGEREEFLDLFRAAPTDWIKVAKNLNLLRRKSRTQTKLDVDCSSE